ncbi:MAG TPA: type II toxin-antitoxin system VapC family toxin [Candidatus Saccharimonadales bacterium]|nr:type II toxin-antitoxin system VapC family toxin [Candidatus Saccharimonadales bacterium]
MSFTLDTSAYSAFNRGDKRLRAWFSSDNDIIVPIIVVGELRAGFAAGSKHKENEELLQRFLDSTNVYVQTITDKTTVIYSQIYLKLREKGKPIGSNDMWIAAITLELDNELLTLDDDFASVPDLMLGTI